VRAMTCLVTHSKAPLKGNNSSAKKEIKGREFRFEMPYKKSNAPKYSKEAVSN